MGKSTDLRIVEATISTFVKYGPKKTAIADIAEEAGVSRKTIYDRFGGKAELSVAVIRHKSELNLQAAQNKLKSCQNLEEQLNAYLEMTVMKSFRLVQKSADPEGLISGFTPAAKEAIAESRVKHAALIASVLEAYEENIITNGETVSSLAAYFVKTSMALKYNCTEEKEIKSLLKTLSTVVLSMTK